MKFKRLYHSSIKLSLNGQGTDQFGNKNWGYGRSYNDNDIEQIIDACLDNGINFFDTGELYGYGISEKILGRCLAKYSRDEYYIVSKVPPWNLRYNDVIKTLNSSLKRLRTNYIDFFLVHHPNPFIPMKETFRAFEYLKKHGRISHIGVSNFNKYFLQKAMDVLKSDDIALNEIEYNIFCRDAEKRILPFCFKNKIDVVAYSPFAGGLLTGKYDENNLPRDRSRKFNLYNNKEYFIKHKPLFNVLNILAEKYDVTIPEVVLSFITSKNIFVIPGSLSKNELLTNIKSVKLSLSSSDIELINQYSNVDLLKHHFDHKLLRPIGWMYQGFRKQFGLTKYQT